MSDRIEKTIELKAPIARVWRALTDHREFGGWVRVKLESPFVVGQVVRGRITHPGYEHITWQATVTTMEPERPTLVEFQLAPIAGGTRLTVTESGFDKIPAGRRAEAFRMNDRGWTEQMKNVARHVAA